MNRKEWMERGNQLFAEAKTLLLKEDADAQDAERRDSLLVEGRACMKHAANTSSLLSIWKKPVTVPCGAHLRR